MRVNLSVLFWLLSAPAAVQAQSWGMEPVQRIVAFTDTATTDHLAMDMEGDVLVLTRCTSNGGEVRLHRRDLGGSEAWGAFAVITDPRPGFGFSVDLDQGRLAIGIRDGVGAVLVMDIDPDALDPLDSWDEFVPPGGDTEQRFGHSVKWWGDTLFVGADRYQFANIESGRVLVLAAVQGALTTVASILPPTLSSITTKRFGSSIVCDGAHLAISAPHSTAGVDQRGAIFIYKPDNNSVSGWVFSDTLTDTGVNDTLRDLGREGLFLIDSALVVHSATMYVPSLEVDLDSVPRPTSVGGCADCNVRTYRLDTNGDWVDQGTTDRPGGGMHRARQGWLVNNNEALATGYDTIAHVWRTMVYNPSWTVTDTIPEVDTCDSYNGPMLATPAYLVRTSIRSSAGCGTEVIAEIFERQPVGMIGQDPAQRGYRFFPSPASHHTSIVPPVQGPGELFIHSTSGQLAKTLVLPHGSTSTLDLKGLVPGIYLVSVRNGLSTPTPIGRVAVY